MLTFEQFWNLNKDKYTKLAMEDFNLLNSHYKAIINIHTDDDFSLDLGYSFTLYGETKFSLIQNVTNHLLKLQVVNIKTIRKIIDGQVTDVPDYSLWFNLREEALKELSEYNDYIEVGGNQTITIEFSEYNPEFIKE